MTDKELLSMLTVVKEAKKSAKDAVDKLSGIEGILQYKLNRNKEYDNYGENNGPV